MLIDDIGIGMILTQDVIDERGNLLLEKGITLTRSYISRLKRLGIRSASVADPYAESLKQNLLIAENMREDLSACFTELFQMKAADILNFKPPADHLGRISTVVDQLIDEISPKLDQVTNAQVRKPTADETEHAVNVCLLSLITGFYLKFERETLRELAMGALLHDLGKSMLPPTEEDKAYLHTVYGREMLQRSNLGTTIARIAAEHHECVDGSGHPKGLVAKDTHPLSRLVGIANHFDNALTSAGQDRTSRQQITESMMAGGGTQFDLNLLRAFLNNVAIFPVGSLVRLSTGRTGYIINNRVHFPLRPMVRVIEDYGHTDIDLIMKPNITITDLVAE